MARQRLESAAHVVRHQLNEVEIGVDITDIGAIYIILIGSGRDREQIVCLAPPELIQRFPKLLQERVKFSLSLGDAAVPAIE